jgi:hypothetical protein
VCAAVSTVIAFARRCLGPVMARFGIVAFASVMDPHDDLRRDGAHPAAADWRLMESRHDE